MTSLTKPIRGILVLSLALTLGLAGVGTAFAQIWMDLTPNGLDSMLVISGDNSDNAGYLAGETVHVDVADSNAATYSCEALADSAGAWSCQIPQSADNVAESYSYTATGQTSGVSQSGTLEDPLSFVTF